MATSSRARHLRELGGKDVYRAKLRACRARDKHCVLCGSYEGLSVDHIVPLCLGGDSELPNLRLLCHPCHTLADAELCARSGKNHRSLRHLHSNSL